MINRRWGPRARSVGRLMGQTPTTLLLCHPQGCENKQHLPDCGILKPASAMGLRLSTGSLQGLKATGCFNRGR